MIRRLLAPALCLGLAASMGPPLPAHAEPPVTTITVPSPLGPNATALLAVADGAYLFADGRIYDDARLVDVVEELVGASLSEFTGDEVVLTRGVSGEEQVVLVDLVDDTVTVADVPPGVRAAGVEGWVVERVFHAWDGSSWPLPDVEGLVTQQAGGHLVFGAGSNLAVIDIATREVRDLGRKGNSQQISDDGLGWRSTSQDCYWPWDEADPTCEGVVGGSAGVRLGRDTTVSMKFAEYPLPSRVIDHMVWSDGRWVPAPAPAGVRVTACGVPSGDALCVGSSATGRAIYVIEPDGTWRTAVTLPAEPVEVLDLALTPNALYGTDSRGTSTTSTPAWVRTGPQLQTETRLQASGAVDASAGRGLIGLQWFEGQAPGVRASNEAGGRDKVSGPFILNKFARGVFDITGKRRKYSGSSNPPVDIFGTAQMWSDHVWDEEGGNYPVLTSVSGDQRLVGIWGPFVYGYTIGTGTFVKNWHTGAMAYIAAGAYSPVWGVGDGILVTHDAKQGLIKVFDITNLTKQLAPKYTFHGTPHSIERNRLVWTTPGRELKISTLPFGGTTAPMMLGLMHEPIGRGATTPWTPAFDFSAPLAAGRIVVKNTAGAVVRNLPTPASPSGSLRLTWKMQDDRGSALADGAYTWELDVKDAAGRNATLVNRLEGVTGILTVGPPVSVATVAPAWEVPCGEDEARLVVPDVFGITYEATGSDTTSWTVRAKPMPGFALTGKSEWTFTTPTQGKCTAPAPTFVDRPGTINDRLIIPSSDWPVSHYSVDGGLYPAGTHAVAAGRTLVVRAHFKDAAIRPIEWRHTYSTAGGSAPQPQDPYSETGEYLINGRRWRTTCEPYSVTRRCRTEIWATQTSEVNGKFISSNGWAFNNLTYLASPRVAWKGNPLAETKTWVAADGRKWRTECDTALTGKNGCRSFIEARVIEAKSKAGGGYTYTWVTRWIFNNMVRFN